MLAALLLVAASGHAVILSGATDKASAEALHQTWSAVESLTQAAGVKAPPEYPKLIHSDDVKGLKPGFWIWVLGYCNKEQANAQLEIIKRVFSGAYSRPVEVPKLDCVAVSASAGFGKEAKLGKVGALEVRTIETTDKEEDASETGRDDAYDRTIIHVMLYDAKTKTIVDSVPVEGPETHSYGMNTGGGSFSCSMKVGALKGKKLVLERVCRSPTPECGSYAAGRERTTVLISDGGLSADLEKKEFDYVKCD